MKQVYYERRLFQQKMPNGNSMSKPITTHNCYFCEGNHSCRECPIELKIAPYMKKIVGLHMEDYVVNNLPCPRCSKQSLRLLGNHTPSLDIVCDNCYTNFEVKSKCLSVNNLPKDLILPHGNYFDYLARQRDGLDFIIIIYKVNRSTKNIEIRKLLHVPHEIIKTDSIFYVQQKPKSSMSTIHILDHMQLKEINVNYIYNYNFTNDINSILEGKSAIYVS